MFKGCVETVRNFVDNKSENILSYTHTPQNLIIFLGFGFFIQVGAISFTQVFTHKFIHFLPVSINFHTLSTPLTKTITLN